MYAWVSCTHTFGWNNNSDSSGCLLRLLHSWSSALILESSVFNVHLATHYQPLWLNLTAQTECFLKPLGLSRVSVED